MSGARLNAGPEVDLSWYDQAECSGQDEEKGAPVFFPTYRGSYPRGEWPVDQRAKALCAVCPVREECLEHALTKPERWGVWGGLNENEREELRKKMRAS